MYSVVETNSGCSSHAAAASSAQARDRSGLRKEDVAHPAQQ
jgi:hypothetical protein